MYYVHLVPLCLTAASEKESPWVCTPLRFRLFDLRVLLGVIPHVLQIEPELELALAHPSRKLEVIVFSPYCAHLCLQAGFYMAEAKLPPAARGTSAAREGIICLGKYTLVPGALQFGCCHGYTAVRPKAPKISRAELGSQKAFHSDRERVRTSQRAVSLSPSLLPESWAARLREERSSASFSAICAAMGRRCCSGAGRRREKKGSSSSCIAVGLASAGGPRHLRATRPYCTVAPATAPIRKRPQHQVDGWSLSGYLSQACHDRLSWCLQEPSGPASGCTTRVS